MNKKWIPKFIAIDIIRRLIWYDFVIANKEFSGRKINALLTVVLNLWGLYITKLRNIL